MIHQARAESTRRTILGAAVEVLDEVGYSNASLTEVIDRAGVTKGAFYYHFPTKAAMAAAIVADCDLLIEDAARAVRDSSSTATALESLIRTAFVIADRAGVDKSIRVGIQLTDALGDVAGHVRSERQRTVLVGVVEKAISEGDVRTDVNAEDLGHALWVALVGNHLLSEAAGQNLIASQARVLRILLAGVCTDRSAPFFDRFVDRLAGHYEVAAAGQH